MALRKDYQPSTAMLSVRLRKEELEDIKKAAKTLRISLADAVREILIAWAKKPKLPKTVPSTRG
jgi:hypothetical protein